MLSWLFTPMEPSLIITPVQFIMPVEYYFALFPNSAEFASVPCSIQETDTTSYLSPETMLRYFFAYLLAYLLSP